MNQYISESTQMVAKHLFFVLKSLAGELHVKQKRMDHITFQLIVFPSRDTKPMASVLIASDT
jgi:hypothetical protein